MNKRSYLSFLLFFVCAVFNSVQAMDDLRNARQLRLYQQAVGQNNLEQLRQLRTYLVEHELVAQEEIDGHITRLGGTVPEVQPAPQPEQAEAAPQPGTADAEGPTQSAEAPGEMDGEEGESTRAEHHSQDCIFCREIAEQPACMQQTEQRLALLRAAIEACDVDRIRQCLYVRLADMPYIFETAWFAALSDEDQEAVRAHFDAVTRNIARNLEDDARIFHNDPIGFVERLEPAAVWFGVLTLGTLGRRCCACRECMFSQENHDLERISCLLCDYFCHLIAQERAMLQQACGFQTWQDCHQAALDQHFTALLNATLSHGRNIHRIFYLWYHYFPPYGDKQFRARALNAIRNFADIVIENRNDYYSPEERLGILYILFDKQDDPYSDRIKEAFAQTFAQLYQDATDRIKLEDAKSIIMAHSHAIMGTYHFICTRMMHDSNAIEEGHLNMLLQLLSFLFTDQAQYRALLIQLAQSLQTEGGESAELLRNLLAHLHELQEAQQQVQEANVHGHHVHPLPPPTTLQSIGMFVIDHPFPIVAASGALFALGWRLFRGRR